MNSIGSWLAENGSKHALVINIGSVASLLLFQFFDSHVKAYIYGMYLEILSKYEVLMFALRSLGPY